MRTTELSFILFYLSSYFNLFILDFVPARLFSVDEEVLGHYDQLFESNILK